LTPKCSIKGKEINAEVLDKVYSNVFRNGYKRPGFFVLSFSNTISSRELRAVMVNLKQCLSARCRSEFKMELDYFWLTRFDQQQTTKFHRDNAPTDSFLLLGYEPTTIESKLLIADYHKFISDYDIPIEKYYELYNPIFKAGEQQLKPYITAMNGLDKNAPHIVIINNSDLESQVSYGVLHKAEMLTENENHTRVVNSMMLYLKSPDESYHLSKNDVTQFLETDRIEGSLYN